jgi:hypothetical protein
MAGYDVANAPDNVFLAELENMQGDGTRLDLMFQEPEAATNQPKVVDHFHRQRSQQWRQLLRQGRLESLRQLQNHSAKLTTDTVLINYSLGRHKGCTAEELHTSEAMPRLRQDGS